MFRTTIYQQRSTRGVLAQRTPWLPIVGLSLVGLLLTVGCGSGKADVGPATISAPETRVPGETPTSVGTPAPTATPASVETPAPVPTPASRTEQGLSYLSVVQKDRNIAMENGASVSLGDGEAMEVFVSPYPAAYDTDLHLFLLKEDTFEPVTDAVVFMLYEMVQMDHGDGGKQMGSQVDEGHYRFPMFFIMYGEYEVSVHISWPNAPQLKQTVVKLMVLFYPEGFLDRYEQRF